MSSTMSRTFRMGARRGAAALLAGALAGLLSACALLGGGDGAQMQGEWVLVAAEDPTGAFDLSPADVTLTVQGSALSGTAACNQYGGTVTGGLDASDERPVSVSDLFQTEMACMGEGVMELEARYLTALAAVESGLRLDDDTMALFGGGVRLEFALLIEG